MHVERCAMGRVTCFGTDPSGRAVRVGRAAPAGFLMTDVGASVPAWWGAGDYWNKTKTTAKI